MFIVERQELGHERAEAANRRLMQAGVIRPTPPFRRAVIKDTLPNTLGKFRTVAGPTPALVVDAISIALTNAAARSWSWATRVTVVVD